MIIVRKWLAVLLLVVAPVAWGAGCGDDPANRADAGTDSGADAHVVLPDASGIPDAQPLPDVAELPDASVPTDATTAERVLFVGNSYTASNSLATLVGNLLTEAGLGGYTLAVTPGGYRLEQHADDADGTNGDTTLRQYLVTGPEATQGWDVVVLQEQSQIPGFPQTDPYWVGFLDGATRLRDLSLAAGADVVLFVTWGRRDGDSQNPARYPDYAIMQDLLTAGYSSAADQLSATGDPIYLSPVGEAWRAVHDAGNLATFEGLYSADGSHPSLSGSYLAACVFFATLTGSSPVGLQSAPAGIDATERAALQSIAEALVLDPTAPDRWTR